MIVETDFLDHWKTQLLIDKLGDDRAPIYLLRLWSHCQNRKQDYFPTMDSSVLKAVCRYPGDDFELWEAMICSQWIDCEDSGVTVRGFRDINSKLFNSWENGSKGGRSPKKKPTKNPPETHGEPTANPQASDKEDKEDKSREEKKELERIESSELRSASSDWLAYKREKRQGYKPQGLKSFISTVISKAEELGIGGAIADIRGSSGDGYQGVAWGKYSRQRGSPNESRTDRMFRELSGMEDFFSGDQRDGEEGGGNDLRLLGPPSG